MADSFAIDVGDLGGEWVRQASRTRAACVRVADAEHALAQAKARLELVEAEVRRQVRADPARYELDKATEKAVEDVVVCSKRRRRAAGEVADLKHALDVLKADLAAEMDRRRGLENAVELLQIDYYGEPREARTSRAGLADVAQAAARRPLRKKANDAPDA